MSVLYYTIMVDMLLSHFDADLQPSSLPVFEVSCFRINIRHCVQCFCVFMYQEIVIISLCIQE